MSPGQPSTLPVGGQYPTTHTGWPPDAPQAGTTIYTPGSTTSQQSSESVYYFSGASSISSAGSMVAPPATNISIYNFNYSSSPPPPRSLVHRSSVNSGHNSNCSSSSSLPHSFMHCNHDGNHSLSSSPPYPLMHHSHTDCARSRIHNTRGNVASFPGSPREPGNEARGNV